MKSGTENASSSGGGLVTKGMAMVGTTVVVAVGEGLVTGLVAVVETLVVVTTREGIVTGLVAMVEATVVVAMEGRLVTKGLVVVDDDTLVIKQLLGEHIEVLLSGQFSSSHPSIAESETLIVLSWPFDPDTWPSKAKQTSVKESSSITFRCDIVYAILVQI